jgi:hypothetical protein
MAFRHYVTFLGGGGSGSGVYWSGSGSLSFNGSYSSAGSKTVWDTLECSCDNIFVAQAQQAVDVVCPVPTNFRQTNVGASAGVLFFSYTWDSSTGNRADLADCTIHEHVTYPGSNPYSPPSPPFYSQGQIPNPTILPDPPVPATDEGMGDIHSHAGTFSPFETPYSAASVTATQHYRYVCPCANGGQPVNLLGPLSITRSVSIVGSDWTYTITKPTGGQSSLVLP